MHRHQKLEFRVGRPSKNAASMKSLPRAIQTRETHTKIDPKFWVKKRFRMKLSSYPGIKLRPRSPQPAPGRQCMAKGGVRDN